ncbi:hypothetical protein M501DRAFT_1016244 [Patellaria atrata CBS 101060]|uniref:Peptidase M43 pregnancy-associated plasma-A domain-containing protein n=1 Tax=Patellaria atrata CBS 101060 TaxID=1346257 RepID=A0A9P4VPU5_9PEZI|nr:hypothetical protein M501DRAFT_1016244 [Patellaria atrata CBS 101060]
MTVETALNSSSQISYYQIREQINIINISFEGIGIAFNYTGTTHTVNDLWALGYNPSQMGNTLRRGSYAALNIYLQELVDGIGYSVGVSLPSIPSNPNFRLKDAQLISGLLSHGIASLLAGSFWEDGVHLMYDAIPGYLPSEHPGVPQYGLGNVAIHEIGHWYGLFQTFQSVLDDSSTDGCNEWGGDRVMDTPAERYPSFECDPEADSYLGPIESSESPRNTSSSH